MEPKITVIVPIYNVEKYIEKCLSSLKKQTFSDFVVWAVDDGSPDNSKQIVKKYAEKDNRFKLIEKGNGGYGSVLQYCVKQIKTEFFLICDPDDWLAPTALADLYNFSKINNVDITVADRYDVFVDNGEKILHKTKHNDLKNFIPKRVYSNAQDIQKFCLLDVSPHAKLYRTAITRNITFPYHVSFTDFLLYIVALSNSKRIAYYDKPLAYYLTDRPGNSTTDTRIKTLEDRIIVWNTTFDQIRPEKSIIYYYLYLQLCPLFSEYARLITTNRFNDNCWTDILKSLTKFRKYGQNAIKISEFKYFVLENIFFDKLVKKPKYQKGARNYVKLADLKRRIRAVTKKLGFK